MWELYQLLGKGMGQRYIIDEVVEKLKTLSPKTFNQSMKLLYNTVSTDNPTIIALLFINGLKYNRFFEFQQFVETVGEKHAG